MKSEKILATCLMQMRPPHTGSKPKHEAETTDQEQNPPGKDSDLFLTFLIPTQHCS